MMDQYVGTEFFKKLNNSRCHNLPLSYFGVISFYAALYTLNKTSFIGDERYVKQTFRTRTPIIGANGLINLTVPVTRTKGKDSLISDITISYAENWPKEHLKSIESAYRNAPYFIYYFDAIAEIINGKHKTLEELNASTMQFCIEKLGLDLVVNDPSHKITNSQGFDLIIDPKKSQEINIPRYIQCFEERHGFIGNLCILDLILNEGPNAITILAEVALLNPQLRNF